MQLRLLSAVLAVSAFAGPAYPYVGPGLGLGAIGVIAGLFLSLVLAFFAFVWMPVKRMLSRGKADAGEATADES